MKYLYSFIMLFMVFGNHYLYSVPIENSKYISPYEAEEMIIGSWKLNEGRNSATNNIHVHRGDYEIILEFNNKNSGTELTPNTRNEFYWEIDEQDYELILKIILVELRAVHTFKLIFWEDNIILYQPDMNDEFSVNLRIYQNKIQ